MADYVKFRPATAKVGVSMALLALIAGIAEKARASVQPTAQPAGLKFLKLSGLTGTIRYDFLKLETKMIKLTNTVASLDAKVVKVQNTLSRNFYSAQKADRTFLKMSDAATQYLKIQDANAKFLPASSAGSFFQGKGNVVSGALSSLNQTPQQLLSLPGGIIVVSIANTPGAGVLVTIHNGTAGGGVAEVNGSPVALKPNGDTQLPAVQNNLGEVKVQIFPSAGFSDVVSILIGLTPNPTTGQPEAVAQAFTGGV